MSHVFLLHIIHYVIQKKRAAMRLMIWCVRQFVNCANNALLTSVVKLFSQQVEVKEVLLLSSLILGSICPQDMEDCSLILGCRHLSTKSSVLAIITYHKCQMLDIDHRVLHSFSFFFVFWKEKGQSANKLSVCLHTYFVGFLLYKQLCR